jgi:hypothetical protein
MSNVATFTQTRFLTDYARLLGPSLESFICDRVFPAVDVPNRIGNFHDVQGGFGAASPGHQMAVVDGQERPLHINIAVNTATGWNLQQSGLGAQVTTASDAYARGDGLDLEQAAVAVLARRAYQIRERQGAALAFSTSTFSGKTAALSGTDQWDNAASDPSGQAQDAIDNIMQQSGEAPDTLLVGYEVHKELVRHPLIREIRKYSGGANGPITPGAIAEFLGVENYIVGGAVGNTAVEGQTASKAYIWGKFALFCKLRQSPSAMTPQSCLQRFRLAGSTDGRVNDYMLPGEYVKQIDMVWDEQFTAPTTELGYLYSTVVS